MEKGKISIIIPMYNVENYIVKCLESILKQSYKNIEVIVINDGSTDKSKEICEGFVKEDNRIKLINIENQGAGIARNIGIDMAQGEYISFIDSDDYVSQDFLEVLYKAILKENVDIAECRNKRMEISEKMEENSNHEFKVISNIEKLFLLYGEDEKKYIDSAVVTNKLYRMKLFKDIRYPLERKIIDDEFIVYKLIYLCKRIAITEDVMYAYIQSENSIMRAEFKEQRVFDTIEIYNGVYEFFKDKDLKDLIRLILIRYLNYCIELVIKTANSNGIQEKKKKELYHYIEKSFKEKSRIFNKNFQEEDKYKKIYQSYQEELNKARLV